MRSPLRTSLPQLFQHWRDLTAQETEAIQGDDWESLAAAQDRKAQLQSLFPPASEMDSPSRTFAITLIEAEQRNLQALTNRRLALDSERASLDSSLRQLRQLHIAYAPRPGPVWQSYS